MPRPIYNAAACRELIAIAAYVSKASDGPRLCRTPHTAFYTPIQSVGRGGRPRPDLGQRLRSSVCDGPIIVFRHDDRTGPRSHMIVVHLLKGRRDLPKLLARLRNMH